MSDEKVTKIEIVSRIMVALGLGEEGKYGKFFAKEVKKCKNAIKQLTHNLSGELSQFRIEKEKLEDELEDAKEAVSDAYENVKPEDISNNAKMEEFSHVYWGAIEIAEDNVDSIKVNLKELINKFEKGGEYFKEEEMLDFQGTEFLNEQITKYESKIVRIS